MTALAALLGAACGLGVLLLVLGLRGTEEPAEPRRWQQILRRVDRLALRLAAGGVAGVGVGALTRWPVAALMAAGFGAALPTMLGGGRRSPAAVTARVEAVAGWAEMLRDTIAGARGLEGAITATAPVAPLAIRADVEELAAALHGTPLMVALREFAGRVDDPACDVVVLALGMAAQHEGRQVGELLGALAQWAREESAMRMRVAVRRAPQRTGARIVVGTTLALPLLLMAVDGSYLSVYGTALGQMVLLLVGACFAAGFLWMARLMRDPVPARLLGGPEA
jgi:tight adherence protein B